MVSFKDKPISSAISRFHIEIIRTDNYDVSGTMLNDYYNMALDFQGIRQMISRLDGFFDYVRFPQATNEMRRFDLQKDAQKPAYPKGLRDMTEEEIAADRPNLILHVQFRHNATWQGEIRRVEPKESLVFRSQLEMIEILDKII